MRRGSTKKSIDKMKSCLIIQKKTGKGETKEQMEVLGTTLHGIRDCSRAQARP